MRVLWSISSDVHTLPDCIKKVHDGLYGAPVFA